MAPDDKDNIVEFKPKGKGEEKPLDEKQLAKKEMLERLAEGSRRLKQKVRYQHVLYYLTIFLVLVGVVAWVTIAVLKKI